ncbi:MAG: T9SS type A sorting domain-containing protein, partial [Saprospiraceae bacterium]
DIFPSDNIAVSNDIVVGSYDPNEKSEVHNGSIFRESVESGEALVYTIHFQNTGTYPAEKVVIADQLDPLLHAASLQVLTASHPFTWTLQGDGRLEFTFDMIDLPDSMTSQAGSQGFVSFAVKIRPEAPVNSLISNFAAIYFDLNTPVITKTISTRILEKVITTTTDPAPTNIFGLSVSPNPSPAEFNLQWPANIVASRLEVFTIDGRLLAQTQPGAGHTAILNLTTQPEGIYFAVLTDRQGKHYPAKLLLLKR